MPQQPMSLSDDLWELDKMTCLLTADGSLMQNPSRRACSKEYPKRYYSVCTCLRQLKLSSCVKISILGGDEFSFG